MEAAKKMKDDQSATVDVKLKLQDFIDAVGPGYYSYDGSLTTPTCNEVVSWRVMDKTIAISEDQVQFWSDHVRLGWI